MKSIFTYLFVLITCVVQAQVPDKPNPPRLVNNFSKEFPNFISEGEQQTLETELQNFSNETSNQICIVIVDDLGGSDASSYAIELGNKWAVGQNGFKNGVIILIKPTGGKGQRNLFIAVGYGLEGAIPDLLTKRIREDDIEPYFANGQFYDGLQAGVNSLMLAAKGEYHVKQDTSSNMEQWGKKHMVIVLILIVLFVLLLINKSKGGGGGGTYFGGGFIGGFGSGGSSGGGGSSFGGFGGGSFGGGGSGGNW